MAATPEYRTWRDNLPKLEVDGQEYWVVGGDQLRDADETMLEWLRLNRPELLRKE